MCSASDAVDEGRAATSSAELARIAADWWDLALRRSPTWATYLGDRRFDDRLADPSAEAEARHLAGVRALSARAREVDPGGLSPAQRVTLETLRATLDKSLDVQRCRERLWAAVNQLGGPQVDLPQLPQFHTLRDTRDLDTLLARYRAIPDYLSGVRRNLEEGLRTGWTAPRLAVERVLPQLDGLVSSRPEDSPFTTQLALPPHWDAEVAEEARALVRRAVGDVVLPAFAGYRDWLRDAYLPGAREAPGAGALPEGVACYSAMIRVHTGASRQADEVHALGLRELERVTADMRAIALRVTGEEDLPAFQAALRARPDQVVGDEAALVAVARAAVDRATARLPEVFGRLPATPLVVRPLEPFRAAAAPAAFYYPAPTDGSRPGTYYINTQDLASRPLYNQDALAFHEAVPGHHLQISLASEVDDLPSFQRHMRSTAFTEGWALYAELLAGELGLYESDLSRFGALGYQAWRAARLVVDTGLHTRGWSRERAIDFLLEHTALSRTEATNEIDRYIVWPGQALAYMLGRMTFQELRARAEGALGPRFDLRAFHDEVLRYGAIPLDALRGVVTRWIDSQRGATP